MSTLKKIAYGTCATALVTTLLGLGFAWGAYRTLDNPQSLKTAIKDSGLYDSGIGEALEQSQKGSGGQADVPLDQPEVRKIVENAFTPQYVQTETEKVIDSAYSWLHGNSPNLSFSINLSEAKERLTGGIETYLQKRLDTLPACTSADQLPADGKVNPYNAPCLPAGVDKAAVIAEAKSQIANGDTFKQTDINANNLKDEQGTSLAQQLQTSQTVYGALLALLYFSIAFAVMFAAGVVLLSPSRRQGLRNLGIILAVTGAVNGLLAWLTKWGIDTLTREFMKTVQENQAIQEKVLRVLALLVGDIRSYWIQYSVALVALGAASLAVWHFTRPSAEQTAQVLAHDMPPMEPAGQGEHKNNRDSKLPEIKN